MKVHRFMSNAEFQNLVAGKELCNMTNHRKKNGSRTTSIGFCFFTGDPDKEVHRLSGVVDLDVCVTFDVPENYLRKSFGMYLDEESTDMSKPMNYEDFMREARYKKVEEYCRCRYSLDAVTILGVTTKYASMYPPRSEYMKLIKPFLQGVKI